MYKEVLKPILNQLSVKRNSFSSQRIFKVLLSHVAVKKKEKEKKKKKKKKERKKEGEKK